MARCEVCGKVGGFGHNVSYSGRRTKTRWLPNIHKVTLYRDGKRVRAKVCTRCLRTLYRVR